jgi:hypothetical protein
MSLLPRTTLHSDSEQGVHPTGPNFQKRSAQLYT